MKKHDDKNDEQAEDQVDQMQTADQPEESEPAEELADDSGSELEELKERISQLEGQLKRAVADYQNLEKRIQEGRSELSSWATSDLIKKLLPIMDYFDKATTGVGEDEKKSGWYRGVELALQQLRRLLKDEGLEEIEVKTDSQFDPSHHEAVDTREGDDNMILEVVEKGYNLNGKVVKPVKVIVGKQSS